MSGQGLHPVLPASRTWAAPGTYPAQVRTWFRSSLSGPLRPLVGLIHDSAAVQSPPRSGPGGAGQLGRCGAFWRSRRGCCGRADLGASREMEATSGWQFLCLKAKLCVHVSVAFLGSPSGDMSRSLLTIWWGFIFRNAHVGLASVAQWFTCEPGGHGLMSGHMPGFWVQSPLGGLQRAADQ